MTEYRQKLLVLYLANSTPNAAVIGWSEYDGSTDQVFEACGEKPAPYRSALEAMRDGWRIIQFPVLNNPSIGREFDNGYLEFEFILEKWEAKNV